MRQFGLTKSRGVGRGWHGDRAGHALAGRGIKSKSQMSQREKQDAREIMMRKVKELEAKQKRIQRLLQEELKMEVA